MKKVHFVPALFLALLCFSCTTEEPAEAETKAQEFVTVDFKLRGELSVSQVPLKTSEDDQDHPDLFGIQIYQANGFPYAYVVGDDLSEISVDLPKDEVFTVKATYVKDGKEKIIYRPRMEEWGSPFPTQSRSGHVLNKVIYSSGDDLRSISHADVDDNDPATENRKYVEVDRYYGKVEEFVPTEANNQLTMELKRMVFGLKLNLRLKEPEGVDTIVFRTTELYAERDFIIPVKDGVGTLEIPYLTLAVPEWMNWGVALDKVEDLHLEYVPISIGTPENHSLYYVGEIQVKRNTMMLVNHTLVEEETVGSGFEN